MRPEGPAADMLTMAKLTIGYDGSQLARDTVSRVIKLLTPADTVGLRYGDPLLSDPAAEAGEGAVAEYERLGDELCELLIEAGVNPESVVWQVPDDNGRETPDPSCLIVVGTAARPD